LPSVRRSDAECAHNRRPAGVTRSFQVSENSIEPDRRGFALSTAANLSDNVGACDLLAKNNGRLASADEVEEHGPQVSVIVVTLSFSRAAKRLTRTASSPDTFHVFQAGPPQRQRPATYAAKEVRLPVAAQIIGLDVRYRPAIHVARGNLASGNQFAQPRARLRIVVIVVVHEECEHSNIR